jgi:hypothetical protein
LAALASVSAHVALLAFVAGAIPGCTPPSSGYPQGEKMRDLSGMDKEPVPLQVTLLGDGQGMTPEDLVECEGGEYVGIGIWQGPGGAVLMVGDNTPASRAGMRVGDVLLNGDILEPNRYPKGTAVRLRVLRGGAELLLTIFVGRVCFG